MNEARIVALSHLVADGDTVASAEACATAALSAIAGSATIVIDFTGLRGASPSYFSVLLDLLLEARGRGELTTHFKFVFDTCAQELLFNRSYSAVVGA
jgi:hypothetical protein